MNWTKHILSKFPNFIRIIDYTILYFLQKHITNCLAAFAAQFFNDNRKQGGLFQVMGKLEGTEMQYQPDLQVMQFLIQSTIKECIKVGDRTSRVLYYMGYEDLTANINSPGLEQRMVQQNEAQKMEDALIAKVTHDFELVDRYAHFHFRKVIEIEKDLLFYQQKNLQRELEKQSWEDDRCIQELNFLKEWQKLITDSVVDKKIGAFFIEGRKIRQYQNQHIKAKVDFIKEKLYQFMKQQQTELFNEVKDITKGLL